MKTKLLENLAEVLEIADRCQACYVAMTGEDGKPYIVPMNFGLFEGNIYLHSSQNGKKITALRKNPDVCVSFSTDHALRWQNENVACSWGMRYRSVLAHGKVEFIEDFDKKQEALNIIMRKYAGRDFTFGVPSVNEVCTWRVVVEKWEGKVYGY